MIPWKKTVRCPARLRGLLLVLLSSPVAAIDEADVGKPVWEAGVGLAALYYPHYLGADQEKFYLLPLPYFIYRGEYISADRGGLRGEIYDSEKLDLRISLRGSLPVNSDDSDAREGMDDLDLLLEAGPNLQYHFYETPTQMLRFDFPVRAAFSVGSSPFNHEGWTTTPGFHHEYYYGDWIMTTRLMAVYSDRRYHGYIYDVNGDEVRADRPYYQSKSGYTATRFSFGVRRRFEDLFVGLSLSYYDLSGARNDDSPLLKQDEYLAVSLAVAWVLGESADKVQRHHLDDD